MKIKTLSILFLAVSVTLIMPARTLAQACVPPAYQGFANSCKGINARWLNKNAVNDIAFFKLYWAADGKCSGADNQGVPCDSPLAVLPGSATNAGRTDLYPGFSSAITITQTLNNGLSCATASAGSVPHTYPPDLCQGVGNQPLGVVNAANYRSQGTPDSIAAAFAANIATFTALASGLPLPLNVGGVTVTVDGEPAGIFYVSPGQVNFLVPADLSAGLKVVRVANASGQTFTGEYYLGAQAPGVFTRDSTGEGPASMDVGPGGAYISLYPTGINSAAVTKADIFLRTSTGRYPAQYLETPDPSHPAQFVGARQLNFVNVPLDGQAAYLEVAGFTSNTFTLRR